jgi:outer membrane translocation and assembly module TamA
MRKFLSGIFLLASLHAAPVPIYFEGNEKISSRELYEAIGLREPYFFEFWEKKPSAEPATVKQLASTLESYVKSRGYYHNRIGYTLSPESITFTIKENRPIRIADIQTISPLDIVQAVPFAEGDVFDSQLFTKSKTEIKRRYADEAYCNAELDAKAWVDIETDKAYLLYEVFEHEPCRFGEISVHAPKDIEPWIVTSFLRFKEGEPYSNERIRQSYDLLYAQQGISQATINVSERKEESVPVSVTVQTHERPIHFNAGIGLSSDEGLILLAGVKHRNFFGNLKTLGLEGRHSDVKDTLRSFFTMPLRGHNLFGAEVGFRNERFDGYKERSNYEMLYLQQYDLPHSFQESLLFDHATTYDSNDETLFPESSLLITSPAIEWKYDVRDKLLEPTKGYYVNIKVAGSVESFLSDSTYLKGLLSGGYLYPLGESSVAGARIRLGSIRRYAGELPSSYRFYAGGMNSNRAYRYRMLGPTNEQGDPVGFQSVMEGTLEYRFPIWGEFRGVLFSDTTIIGQDYAPDYNKPYTALGAGLRYMTPIGPIAVDFGFDIKETTQYALHFHIGELF